MDSLKAKEQRRKKFARSDKKQDHGTRGNGEKRSWKDSLKNFFATRRRDFRAVVLPEEE